MAHLTPFERRVRQDLTQPQPNESLLSDPERWRIVLKELLESERGELRELKADLAKEEKHRPQPSYRQPHEQHVKSLRRTVNLKQELCQRIESRLSYIRKNQQPDADVFRAAIFRHRTETLTSGIEPEQHDIDLWLFAGASHHEDTKP